MVSIVSALGAGSGIDTTSLVEQLVDVERSAPQTRIDSKKESLAAQVSAYGSLKSSLSTFQDSLSSLSSTDLFSARAVSIPDTDIITANSLAAGAQTGTFQIEVKEIAQAHTLVGNSTYDTKNNSLSVSGNLTIKLGSWEYDDSETSNPTGFTQNEDIPSIDIEVLSTDTLQDIADKINDADSDVQATVLQVDGSYQLMMSGPSGESNALEITSEDASLAAFTYSMDNLSSMTETQAGQDAEISMNGLTVFRSTNEVDDLIAGLDFSINKASPGEKISFTITDDSSTAEDAIRGFVDAYNTFYESAKSLVGVATDSETEESVAGQLSSDGTAKSIISRVRSMISASVGGVDDFNALTNIGIRTQLDGTLEIIDDEFEEAMNNSYDKVAALFAPKSEASTSAIEVGLGSYSGEAVPGSYDVVITTAASKGQVSSDQAFSAFNTADTSSGDFTFSVSVDGTTSETLTLEGNFTSADELRSALQTLINNDSNLKEINIGVDVVSNDDGTFSIISGEFGSSSKVTITSAGADFASTTGFSEASISTTGTDVAGTINGESTFGSGNILLPGVDSDAYGLNLTIQEGLTGEYSFNFSRGFAGEMSLLIDEFLDSSSGAIAMREDNINDQIDGLDDDQESLDRRITMFEERLTAQFTAMEAIISSLQSTGDSLSSLFDTLPYTASSN